MALLPGDIVRGISGTNRTTYWASGYFSVRVQFTPTVDMLIDAIEVDRMQGAVHNGTVGIAATFQGTSTIPWVTGLRGKPVKGDHTVTEQSATNPMRVQLQDTALLKAGTAYAFVMVGSAAPIVAPTVPTSGAVNMTTGGTYYSFNNPPTFETNQPSYAAIFHLIESVNAKPGGGGAISPTTAYGSRTYGGGAGFISRGPVGMGMSVTAGAQVKASMDTRTKQGDIVALAAPATGPSDITLIPAEGPNTLATGPAGVATMTADTWQSHSVSSHSAGKSVVSINLGQTFAIFSTSVGKTRMRSLGIFNDSWYLGSPWHVDSIATGVASSTAEMTVFAAGIDIFTTRVFVYDSRLNPSDINLAPEGGPGETHSFLSTSTGRASVSINMTNARPIVIAAAGRAGAADQIGSVGSWYLGSPFHVTSTSAGAAGARDQLGNIGSWYLGSPFHATSTSNGRGGLSYNYLGSPFRVDMTSNGRGGSSQNKLSGAVYLSQTTSAGRGGARDQFGTAGFWYLGSPHRVAMTSAGVAGGESYLAGPTPIPATTSSGAAGGTWYLAGPVILEMTSRGHAVATAYLASKVYQEATSNGRAALPINSMGGRVDLPGFTSRGCASGSIYTSTPIRMALTANGRGISTFYLAGRTELHMKTYYLSGGGGQWYLASRVTLAATSYARATFEFKSDNFGVTVSRGVASVSTTINVEFGQESRNRFAMAINAGCRAYDGYRSDTNPQFFSDWGGPGSSKTGYTGPQGVFFYQTGATYLPVVARGVATMRENEEFIPWNFRTTINAGCRAGLPNPNLAITIYLSSKQHFLNNDPNDDWRHGYGGKSTMGGVGTFDIEPDFEFKADAGCRVGGNHYRADDNPALFRANGNTYVPYAGVSATQIGTTYMTTTTNTYSFSKPTLVHITLSAPQRLYWTANGVGRWVAYRNPDSVIFSGKGGVARNYFNIASYDLQEWHSHRHGDGDGTLYPRDQHGNKDPRARPAGGVGFFTMYGAGRVEQAARSNGVGGMPNYLNGPVYLGMFSDGVSGPNWLDIFGFEQDIDVKAGCYPYQAVSQPTNTDPGGKVTTLPALLFEQDKIRVSLSMGIVGISTMQIEINGVPIIRWKADAKALARFNLEALRDYKGFVAYAGSYGHVSHRERYGYTFLDTQRFPHPYGVAIEQFQRRDWQADGVGKFMPLLGLAYYLVWHKWDDGGQLWPEGSVEFGLGRRAGGRATLTIQDNRRFMEFRTETNNLYYDSIPPDVGYRTRITPLYTPDVWTMVVDFALEMRSRGRARFRDKMLGDLLARYYSAPQPGTPTIDGHARPAHGQYWPRKIVLPWAKVPVTHPQWYEYEYYRR